MACSCKNRPKRKFEWTSLDGESTMVYDTEIQAKAKVLRKGGTYRALPPA